VYVDRAATAEAVRSESVADLPTPAGVLSVDVAAAADTFGCGVAVDLTGTFDENG
jgi:hypothetical protein